MDWGKVVRFLKPAGKIGATLAGEVLKTALPQTAGLVSIIQAKILDAEADLGPGKGKEKKEWVMGEMTSMVEASRVMLPLIVPMIEKATKVDIDDDLFTESVSKLIDGLVGINNSMKVLPKQ